MVEIELKFNIMQSDSGGRIMIPGCEPTSALTSTMLDAEMNRQGICKASVAKVNDVLAAIPGSRVVFIDNAGMPGSKKLLVLPPYQQSCPSSPRVDYYQILKGLGQEIEGAELQDLLSTCEAFPMEEGAEWRGQ